MLTRLLTTMNEAQRTAAATSAPKGSMSTAMPAAIPRDLSRFSRNVGQRAVSTLGALALLAALAPMSPLPSGYAEEARDPRDHDSRIQFVVKSITITNDHDIIGDGEFEFFLEFRRENPDCPNIDSKTCLMAESGFSFSAGTGETVPLNHSFPSRNSGSFADGSVTPATGFPVRNDQVYYLELNGIEYDALQIQEMGILRWELSAANGWDLGTRTEPMYYEGIYSGGGGYKLSGALVEYEIRKMALPDLRPTQIRVGPVTALGSHRVCVPVQNVGIKDSAPFRVTFELDGNALVGGTGSSLIDLDSGQVRDICVDVKLPTSGTHMLTATVDPNRDEVEESETNNRTQLAYTGVSGVNTPAPASLTVQSIQAGDTTSPDACKSGKNDVAVTVKNVGQVASAPSRVRLAVDGQIVGERDVPALQSDKSLTLTFDDIKLKKGTRALKTTLDASGAAEDPQGSTEKSVTLTCSDK